MSEHIEKTLSAIDQCLGEISQHTDPEVIAEEAWHNLEESIQNGWMDQIEAEQLYFRWFQRSRPNGDGL